MASGPPVVGVLAARGDGPTWGPRAHHLRPQAMKFVASQCDSIRESLLSANHFGSCQGRLAAAGGRRLPEPAVGENEDARGRGGSCGLALLGPRITAANTGVARSGSRARSLA